VPPELPAEQQPPVTEPPPSTEPPAIEEPAQPSETEEPPIEPPAEQPPVPPAGQEPPPAILPAPSGQAPAEQGQTSAPRSEQAEQGETPPAAVEQEESAVEAQFEVQGDEEAVENVRTLREKLRQDFARDDEDRGDDSGREADSGDRRGEDGGRDGRRGDDDRRDGDRRGRDRPEEGEIVFDFGGRFIIEIGNQLVIRQDSAYEADRFLGGARDVDVEHFPGGYSRTVVTRRDGSRIYTVRNRYGDIITRTRVDARGRQIVLIDNRDFYRDGRPRYSRFEDELPPLRLEIPRDQYIVESSRVGRDDIRATLLAPPVEAVERRYALEEVRTSERLRDKVRRIDLNTITFEFGSAAISPSQFEALTEVGGALEDILARSPDEIFLIEGHTDAVGSDTDNLVLSDRRAESIAVALSSNFAIPPENLVTQGYGEQYLKVPTEEPERENRRVTVRRITPLVAQAN
jgi:outer membrane protein OmpA-like peptidoglycan-associated protein